MSHSLCQLGTQHKGRSRPDRAAWGHAACQAGRRHSQGRGPQEAKELLQSIDILLSVSSWAQEGRRMGRLELRHVSCQVPVRLEGALLSWRCRTPACPREIVSEFFGVFACAHGFCIPYTMELFSTYEFSSFYPSNSLHSPACWWGIEREWLCVLLACRLGLKSSTRSPISHLSKSVCWFERVIWKCRGIVKLICLCSIQQSIIRVSTCQ